MGAEAGSNHVMPPPPPGERRMHSSSSAAETAADGRDGKAGAAPRLRTFQEKLGQGEKK